MKINFVKGDATRPKGKGKKIICHICNDYGAWGAGFVLALSKRWTYPEHFYRARHNYPLGQVDILSVDTSNGMENEILVANMIAQHGLHPNAEGVPPIRYDALAIALKHVSKVAEDLGATLHMPRIGCGLAGGEWSNVQQIIEDNVHVDVTVYDL